MRMQGFDRFSCVWEGDERQHWADGSQALSAVSQERPERNSAQLLCPSARCFVKMCPAFGNLIFFYVFSMHYFTVHRNIHMSYSICVSVANYFIVSRKILLHSLPSCKGIVDGYCLSLLSFVNRSRQDLHASSAFNNHELLLVKKNSLRPVWLYDDFFFFYLSGCLFSFVCGLVCFWWVGWLWLCKLRHIISVM